MNELVVTLRPAGLHAAFGAPALVEDWPRRGASNVSHALCTFSVFAQAVFARALSAVTLGGACEAGLAGR